MRAVGDRICGRYEVVAVLGRRPLGVLYRAVDREIGVDVALRLLDRGLVPDEAARQQVVQKLQRGRAFQHPNLVRLYGAGIDGEEVAVAVQWAPGVTLDERLEEGPLPLAETQAILTQVAAGMMHAHQHGVVLGDVRPGSIVVLDDLLKISNVGIGPALPRARYLELVRAHPDYMLLPPEVRAGVGLDARADVYSLASVAVELWTGAATMRPLVLPPAVKAAEAVILRALADDPLQRPATPEALMHELALALDGGARRAQPRGGERPSDTGPTQLDLDPPTTQVPKLDENEGFEGDTTRPGDSLSESAAVHDEVTRQASEDELRLLHGVDVTRQVSDEELFPLRVQSTETQQIALADLEPMEVEDDDDDLDLHVTRAPDGTFRSALPSHLMAEAEAAAATEEEEDTRTQRVLLLEADAMKTTEVPRLPPASSPSPSPSGVRVEDSTLTPLPPPSPAEPSQPQAADEFGDEHLRTNPIGKVDPAELKLAVEGALSKPGNRLQAAARELVVPDRPPPRPESALPKIEVNELPVERAGDRSGPVRTATPPPPFPPAPPAARPQPPMAAPFPSLVPPPRATRQVAPLPAPPPRPPSTNRAAIVLLVLVFFGAVAGIGIGVLHHMQTLKRERERIEKQRLADELNARAEALKHAAVPAPAPGANAAPVVTEPVPAAPPIVTHPDVAPAAAGPGPCPLGANLVPGKAAFCVDVYEYPGGKTIPRTGVSFEEAQRLCGLRGERLCTDVEWEHACRGKGGSSYPYGQAYDGARCNTRTGEIQAAGTFKDCRSGAGAYDMSGNVAEWVVTQKGGQPAQKGGSAQQANPFARCSNTVRGAPTEGGVFIGFRCCADPKADAP